MNEPTPTQPSSDWEYYDLYHRVRDVLAAVPNQFETDIEIHGLEAEDLFSLNSVLGTTIETEVVETLNDMRSQWDPNNDYATYSFSRQAQTFPDVVLTEYGTTDTDPLMGIELKSWYLLSKENEPSFRYKVTPDVCAEQDLLAVFPWALDNAISGQPEVYGPYVVPARYASEYVDYYWIELRGVDDASIDRPDDVSPYPSASERIQDKPSSDSGNNYGRLSRSGMMDEYNERMLQHELSGISVSDWVAFLNDATDRSVPSENYSLTDYT